MKCHHFPHFSSFPFWATHTSLIFHLYITYAFFLLSMKISKLLRAFTLLVQSQSQNSVASNRESNSRS